MFVPDPSSFKTFTREEHSALRPEAGKRSPLVRRGVSAGEIVRFRVRAYHRGEVLPPFRRWHACLLG